MLKPTPYNAHGALARRVGTRTAQVIAEFRQLRGREALTRSTTLRTYEPLEVVLIVARFERKRLLKRARRALW